MRIESLACDNCQEIVDGLSGTAKMKKKYIWIEGKFAVYDWDEHTGERLCNYITKASPSQRQLVFCTVKCLEEYMEGRLKFLEEHRLNRLQQEAQEDFNGRV